MANLVMGAMGSLIPKLGKMLKEEYDLQTGTKERIDKLTLELKSAEAALRKVAQVPWDELDEQVKLWAREVRESSYDMEDILDIYLVNIQGRDSTEKDSLRKRLAKKMTNLFKKSKARHKINDGVMEIMSHIDEVTERCCRYKVEDIVAKETTTSTVDPRLAAMYNKVENLVGIDKSSAELISLMQTQQQSDEDSAKMKIVSIVGVGGLGKTTLAKVVYDKLIGDFDCGAFVPVGRNPDLKKLIKMILIGLDKERYIQFNFAQYDAIHQFIDELRTFLLENKRYFIVIDDMWEVQSWNTIKLAFDNDCNCGGRIIVTTRKFEVAEEAGEVYKLQQLCYDSSKELFYIRMYGDKGNHVDNQTDDISDEILKKCGGIPLAIITMASLLAGKPRDKWSELYKNIGFGRKDSKEEENTTMKILSFSYYDLPLHLRTCVLYLSAFPEDSVIDKHALIWRWIAEGFVSKERGTRLFETGERYYNDLINKSLIQEVEDEDEWYFGPYVGIRVHDIVLDFICSMSHEENFFTVLNDDKDTPLQSPVRRLAQHNRTLGSTHQANHFSGMQTVRSISAQVCDIESWVSLSSFKLLRVLAIESCNLTGGCHSGIMHMGHLVHLRYLSLRETCISRIPEGIAALRFLQTLDLLHSDIQELPSSSSLPTQLSCLSISLHGGAADANIAWVKRLTSLEELVLINKRPRRTPLRYRGERERDFSESVSHLKNLQYLRIRMCTDVFWYLKGLVLPHQLRHLALEAMTFMKLPPWINPSNLPNLSHLELSMEYVYDQDLKDLGRLPELCFLSLGIMWCSAAISNINDSNARYFRKLRGLKLVGAMVMFLPASKESKNISFHLWDGQSDLYSMPSSEDDMLLKVPSPPSAASSDENMMISDKGPAAGPAACGFMPCLQDLRFEVGRKAQADPRCCDSIGWEYLPSLRKITVDVYEPCHDASAPAQLVRVEEAQRRAADEHPNHPQLRITKW